MIMGKLNGKEMNSNITIPSYRVEMDYAVRTLATEFEGVITEWRSRYDGKG